ncbi:zinc transporter ZIP12-like [Hydractinia symbiolongicarpus]|uniref:zinc transporter ZIP12-like n=1 Tax=Hydractinia symbiolongicarpus TaxID=13093 RepID=UPI00254B02C4|nr:zinc transporter ZIP12-like [Hydractinia symbiolongicarpus]
MKYTVILLLCVSLAQVKLEDDDHGHGHEHGDEREHLMDKIAEHLKTSTKSPENHTVFTYKDIQKLFTGLNFKNCSNSRSSNASCNLCLTPKDFLKWYKYDENVTLSEEQFRESLAGVLYFLISDVVSRTDNYSGVVCKTFNSSITNGTSTLFTVFVTKYGGDNGKLNEKSLEKILEDVNKTIGHELSSKKCFSAHEVQKEASNISKTVISEHEFEYATAYIILKLLKKSCIKEDVSPLPEKGFFAEQIFHEFGNKTHLTHKNFEELVEKLNLGKVKNSSVVPDKHHDHRKRRSTETGHDHDEHSAKSSAYAKKCYSGEDMLSIFSVPEGSLINKAKFEKMCPALIQQIESGACNVAAKNTTTTKKEDKEEDKWQPWIGALIATFIVSLGSLSGVLAAPLSKKKWFPLLIMYLIALAVAVLIGDALLHLFPHSLGLHGHEEGESHDHGGENEALKSNSFVWKSMVFLAGVFSFFTFEILMHAFSGHSHSHGPDGMTSLEETHKHAGRMNSLSKEPTKGTLQMSEDAVFTNRNRTESIVINTPAGIHECANEKEYNITVEYQQNYNNGSVNFKNNSDGKSSLVSPSKKNSIKNFKSVVWMVLIGDAIHNFLDGIAIGVAFTETWPSGLHGGISTSIAIFCHELPHELGDFAILLSSGLSIKQALLMNFISSLTAFAGATVGVLLGTTWNAMPWLFACTAGLFVYIALVDMLPEILHSALLKVRPWTCIGLQMFGLLTGWLIMFCLAAWEEDIKSAIK